MTNRVKALTVVLDADIREDDVEGLKKAILCMRNVISVDLEVTTSADHINRVRVRHEIAQQLWEVLYPKKSEKEG